MTYDKWLELINRLIKSSKQEDIDLLRNEPLNPNINSMLIPKIKDMIIEKYNYNINKIINELDILFSDEIELDLALVNLRKSIKAIMEIIDNKQFNEEQKNELRKTIIDGTEDAYKILLNASIDASDDGTFTSIINRNRIKWSDQNELPGN